MKICIDLDKHPLSTPQKSAEALRAKGSERLERQSLYSLFRE